MWVALTEADIATGLTGPELNAAKTAALVAEQTGIVDDVITQVTREVRGRIAACAKNQLGADGTIADECLSAAIDVAVFRLCKRLPRAILLTEERKEANRLAVQFLRDVAACNVTLQAPAVVAEEETAGPAVEIASQTTRRATREKLGGL